MGFGQLILEIHDLRLKGVHLSVVVILHYLLFSFEFLQSRQHYIQACL